MSIVYNNVEATFLNWSEVEVVSAKIQFKLYDVWLRFCECESRREETASKKITAGHSPEGALHSLSVDFMITDEIQKTWFWIAGEIQLFNAYKLTKTIHYSHIIDILSTY